LRYILAVRRDHGLPDTTSGEESERGELSVRQAKDQEGRREGWREREGTFESSGGEGGITIHLGTWKGAKERGGIGEPLKSIGTNEKRSIKRKRPEAKQARSLKEG